MPAIINDKKQQQALQQVTDGLSTIESMNMLLALTENNEGFIISAKSRKKPSVTIDGADASRIRATVAGAREKLVRKVRTIADKQRISFSEEDERILCGPAVETPSGAADGQEAQGAYDAPDAEELGAEGSESGTAEADNGSGYENDFRY